LSSRAEDPPATSRDPSVSPQARVADLICQMGLAENVAQHYGVWVGIDTANGKVAANQHDIAAAPVEWDQLVRYGLGLPVDLIDPRRRDVGFDRCLEPVVQVKTLAVVR